MILNYIFLMMVVVYGMINIKYKINKVLKIWKPTSSSSLNTQEQHQFQKINLLHISTIFKNVKGKHVQNLITSSTMQLSKVNSN